jgi:hypothetical protein
LQGDTLTYDVTTTSGYVTVADAEACLRGEGSAASFWECGAYMPGAPVVADKVCSLIQTARFQEVRGANTWGYVDTRPDWPVTRARTAGNSGLCGQPSGL